MRTQTVIVTALIAFCNSAKIQGTYTLVDSGFFKDFQYQGGVKSTFSRVFEDLKFKISEG